MKITYLIELIAWILTGTYTLRKEKIDKIVYLLVWMALIINIVAKIMIA